MVLACWGAPVVVSDLVKFVEEEDEMARAFEIGDEVTVAVPGQWFCHCGKITAWRGRRPRSRMYEVGLTGWWYARQLTTEPAGE